MVTPFSWHVVPGDVFDALARGGGGARAVRLLAATQRSRRLLLLRGVLSHAAAISESWVAELGCAYDLLAMSQSRSPAASAEVERVLAHPGVTAWVTAVSHSLRTGGAVPLPWYLSATAAAVAVRLGEPAEVVVPVVDGGVLLPTLGLARMRPENNGKPATVVVKQDAAVVRCDRALVRIPAAPHRPAADWEGLPVLAATNGGLRFETLLDAADPACYPTRDSVRPVPDAELERWRATVAAGWALLAEHQPDTACEAGAVLSVLVPLTSQRRRMVSATPRKAFGAVALSEPADAVTFALTLAHETQHAKLNALADLVELVHDDGQARWYAPWRDEPRTLTGLLDGAYAHLGVARFWRGQRLRETSIQAALHAHAEYARWRAASWATVRTLRASGALTPAGQRFADGMAKTLIGWRSDQVPAPALKRAREVARRHRRIWRWRNPHCRTSPA
jgi:HEXXH motif-containing protein